MSTVYRKVYTNDRLPKNSGSYITESKIGLVLKRKYDSKKESFIHINYEGDSRKCSDVEWWLEEVEL